MIGTNVLTFSVRCASIKVSSCAEIMLSQEQLERAHQERDRLVHECITLIHRIAHKPYYLKLLYGVRELLQQFLGYKAPGIQVVRSADAVEEFRRAA